MPKLEMSRGNKWHAHMSTHNTLNMNTVKLRVHTVVLNISGVHYNMIICLFGKRSHTTNSTAVKRSPPQGLDLK